MKYNKTWAYLLNKMYNKQYYFKLMNNEKNQSI